MAPKGNDKNLEDDWKVFYFDNSYTIEQGKHEICEEFGINDIDEMKNYSLYHIDAFGEPAQAIRKEKHTFDKVRISFGDTIILKNNKEVNWDDKIIVNVNVTKTGFSEDCTYLGPLDVSREYTLE